ncbi:hypothetical protein [Photobacterium kagoshimensis]|uniref:hypothetical protein n=1 Tax=Photobacterium kagoshimensis TaxID=2910242 RepID=UPI003D14773A
MDDDLTLLSEFNKLVKNKATIYGRNYIYDTNGCYTVSFYRLFEGVDSSTGVCKLKYLGAFNHGDVFEEMEPSNTGFVTSSEGAVIEGYPLSKNTVSVGEFRVEYKSTYIKTNTHESLLSFSRYWVSDFEMINKSYPNEAKKISELLDQSISSLAKIQTSNGYKSAWVYYRFLESYEYLLSIVNSSILINTCYYFCPKIYYNKYASRFISKSKQERTLFYRSRKPDWNRWN